LALCSTFGAELFEGPTLPGEVLLVALSDMFADLGILQFEVVLELVDVHEPSDGDTVLFEDDILLVEMDALDHRAEVNSGLGERQTLNDDRTTLGSHIPSTSL
jgi:hypothetical protein